MIGMQSEDYIVIRCNTYIGIYGLCNDFIDFNSDISNLCCSFLSIIHLIFENVWIDSFRMTFIA